MKTALSLEYFKISAGILLSFYVNQFPIFQPVPDAEILNDTGIIEVEVDTDKWIDNDRPREAGKKYIKYSNIMPRIYLEEVTRWLELEGLLRAETVLTRENILKTITPPRYQLTAKALNLLGHADAVGGEALSQRLSEAVRNSASHAGRSTISELVGQVIGGIVKSVSN